MSLRSWTHVPQLWATWCPLVPQCLGSYLNIWKEMSKNTDYIIIFIEASASMVEDSGASTPCL